MELGQIRKVDIDQEMQQSYLDYAMSVIVSRALPDARDGLKPVQRRILFAMFDMNINPDSAYKKSARIVGEVLGKYHPHGDMAVYEAMARQAQDFSMRYPSVDGQGNFGSVDGDPPAAMRYTEARLTPFAMELLNQLDRNTVDFAPNFDETLKEPLVLPAAIPNLLVNGASGIAVGMATNIPPHNLGEVVDALSFMLEKWDRLDDVSISDLMKFITGPDFPTGGLILQEEEDESLQAAYATGKGRVLVRGKVNIEELGRGRERLIITELPYLTNKSSLIERIAELTREGILEGLADLRDESDRHGMRIVIELKQGADSENVLKILYQKTLLQVTFGIMLLALVDNEPRMLTLKQALRVYLEHRIQVVRRRSQYDLDKAKQRAHILEGLRIAIQNLDEIINLIRTSSDADQAKHRIIKKFKLDEIQAQAILDMPLRRMASLERKKIEDEYKLLMQRIKELETLLHSEKKLRLEVERELISIKANYYDKRRTQIVKLNKGEAPHNRLTANSLTPGNTTWVGISKEGIIGRTAGDGLPRHSGKQAPGWLLHTNTRDTLYIATKDGMAAAIAVHSIPEVERFSDGLPLSKLTELVDRNSLLAIFSTPPITEINETAFINTISQDGLIKKSNVRDLPGPSAQIFILAKVNPGDKIVETFLSTGKDEFLIVSEMGMAIRFHEDDVRPMGLVAAGVNAIKLAKSDIIVAGSRLNPKQDVLIITDQGFGWRINENEFPRQGRYGNGVGITRNPVGRICGLLVGPRDSSMLIQFSKQTTKLLKMAELKPSKRMRTGSILFEMKNDEIIESVTHFLDNSDIWSLSAPSLFNKNTPKKKIKKKKVSSEKGNSQTSMKEKLSKIKKLRLEVVQLPLIPGKLRGRPKRNKPGE